MHSRNRYNSMSFLLSMQDYDHHLDGAHEDLANPDTIRVAFLELSLLSAMASNLVFHQSGRPRFELIPMRLLSHLRKEFDLETQKADAEGKGCFVLSRDICDQIRETCGHEDVYYSGAVDTEHRLIRVLFFPQGAQGVAHMQVGGAELGTNAINKVLTHVRSAQANILRFQIRRGLNNSPTVEKFGLNDPTKLKRRGVGPGRFDLTFESAVDARTASEVMETIRKSINKDDELKGADIHVTEPPY